MLAVVYITTLVLIFVDTSELLRHSSGCYDTYELVSEHKEVRQSSTRAAGGAASRAVDGGTSGNFHSRSCSHTEYGNRYSNQWWYVNLGSPTPVSKVVIFNRDDCCAERIEGAIVRVGNNSVSPFIGNILCGPKISQSEADYVNPIEITCQQSITGQYVTIYRGGGTPALTLCEVQVYKDISNPVLTCPDDIEVNADVDQSLNPITWGDPEVHDNFHIGLSAACTPSSGSFFEVGFTKVTCSATDETGNNDNCTFVVHVKDNKQPSLICPEHITVNSSIDQFEDPVTWGDPKVTDNVHTGMSANCVPSSGSIFDIGSTIVTCTATDGTGNQGSCSFVVHVIGQTFNLDVSNPSALVCPHDISVNANQSPNVVTWKNPKMTSNVDDDFKIICTPPSGSSFKAGSTKVVCSGIDSTGKEINCWFSVHSPHYDLLKDNTSEDEGMYQYLLAAVVVLAMLVLILALTLFIVYRYFITKYNRSQKGIDKQEDDDNIVSWKLLE